MKKILITTESLKTGGVETSLLSLLKCLNKYKVEIDLYVLKSGELNEEISKICKVNIIPIKIPKLKIMYLIKKSVCCKSLIKKYKNLIKKEYDISIAYYGLNNYCDIFACAAKAKEKIIWNHYNFYEQYKLSNKKAVIKIRNKLLNNKFNYFEKIVTVSDVGKTSFEKIFPKQSKKVLVINNLIDEKRIEKGANDIKIKMKGSNNAVFVGRITKNKCVDILIYEFEKVIQEIPDATLYIIGDGEEIPKLKAIVKTIKLEKNILFLGKQSNPYQFIKQADILVSASSSETYPTTILEALALKTYFISADNEGASTIFYSTNKGNFNNGIVCKQNDIHFHIINYLKNKNNYNPNFSISKENKKIEKELITLLDIKN